MSTYKGQQADSHIILGTYKCTQRKLSVISFPVPNHTPMTQCKSFNKAFMSVEKKSKRNKERTDRKKKI